MYDAKVSATTVAAPVIRTSAILMIVMGLASFFLPGIAGIGVSILVGVVVLLAGVAYALFAFAARGTGTFLWRLMVSVVFTLAGLDLLIHPLISLITLTLVVAVAFFIEGIAELVIYASLRALPRSGFLLVNALFSFLLAFLIWRSWPSNSLWAIGTLVGIDLITTGITRLMFTAATAP